MTTTGPTSAAEPTVTHTSELVERHRITLPAGATGDNVAVARLHAEAYARARGFELRAGDFSVTQSLNPGGEFIGVSFDVHVGHGDIALDQSVPGLLDRWRWSGAACNWWRDILNRADGRQGKLLSLVDDRGRVRRARVTGMRPEDDGTATVTGEFVGSPGGFVGRYSGAPDQTPPWMRRADGDDSEGE